MISDECELKIAQACPSDILHCPYSYRYGLYSAPSRTISNQISPLCNLSCIWFDNMTGHES